MKTIIALFAFFISISAYSQSSDYRVVPVQSGSINLVNGKANVNLEEGTIASLSNSDGTQNTYYVVLTPIGDCGLLKLGEKGNKSFTVTMAGSGSNSGSFDYIVFLKYHLMPLQQNIKPVKFTPPASVTGK